MSLFIHLTVGHHMVDRIRVFRVSVSDYQVDRAWVDALEPLATVTHRYGDGATELARLALNALKETM